MVGHMRPLVNLAVRGYTTAYHEEEDVRMVDCMIGHDIGCDYLDEKQAQHYPSHVYAGVSPDSKEV